MRALNFTPDLVAEIILQTKGLSARQLEWMANVGLRKEFEGQLDEATIRRLEDIYWYTSIGRETADTFGITKEYHEAVDRGFTISANQLSAEPSPDNQSDKQP
jgi:hypothetical protein